MKLDLQTFMNNAVAAQRHEQLKDSPQLLLGELILKLEAVKKKDLSLLIDIEDRNPSHVGSWRGSYCELAIRTGENSTTVKEWIEILKEAIGETFTGYKGGDYVMGKNTPVWLAESGDSGFETKDGYVEAYFVDVQELEERVYLLTKTGENLY